MVIACSPWQEVRIKLISKIFQNLTAGMDILPNSQFHQMFHKHTKIHMQKNKQKHILSKEALFRSHIDRS